MNTMVSSNRSFRSARRLRIWAWTDTSRAETGSSQISRSGSAMSARAMLMRWHWPPENSPGRRSPAASGSMPTASSISRTLVARSCLVPRFQMTSGSATMSLIRRRGLSDEIGSWKIIWILVRTWRRSSPVRPFEVLPW